MSRTFRRLTAVLILALLAGAGAAQALPAAKVKGPDSTRFENPLANVWGWVMSIVEKAGSFIDPDGGPKALPDPTDPTAPSGMTAVGEAGSFIDPDGQK